MEALIDQETATSGLDEADVFHVRIHPNPESLKATVIRIMLFNDAGSTVCTVSALADCVLLAEILVNKAAAILPARDPEIQAAVDTLSLFYGPGLPIYDLSRTPVQRDERAN